MLKTIILVIILFFFSIISQKLNKYLKKGLNYFVGILILFIYAFNKWSNDYESYTGILFTAPESYAESGYIVLVKFIKYFNLDFNFILFLIGVIILFRVKLYLKNYIAVLTLYIIYPLITDLNQVRNTLMILFVISSMNFFSKRKKIKAYIIYAIGISFQSLGWIYLPFFLFLKNIKMVDVYKYSFYSFLLNFILSTALKFSLIKISSIIQHNRIILKLLYYIRPFSYTTFVLWIVLFAIDIYVIERIFNLKNKDEED
ncbi:MAG: EpsG family protein, partial [Fusobacteriaceae bacterium]